VLYGYRDINYAGVTTGKQLHHHGIRDREKVKKIEHISGLKGKRFIVQGLGNMGYWASKFFTDDGALLVGVAEADSSFIYLERINPD
jgi:glutamate dehydrogenase (NAD(P)+)